MKLGATNKARLVILVFVLGFLVLLALSLLLYQQAKGHTQASRIVLYLFSYQILALVFGLCLIYLLVRWLIRPYRRMVVEAAKISPVRGSPAQSESEFVVETFQKLVEELHAKEKELEQLHALERRRAERSERFSERLIANLPSGLVTVDSRGMVTSVNGHAMKIFNASDATTARRAPAMQTGELISPIVDYRGFFRSSPDMVAMIGDCLSRATTFRRQEVDFTLPDGRVRRLGVSVSPIADASQSIEGALCLMTDITEVVELRERMKLQENLANLGEMAAGLAHEFKNSLATIHGYVQLLEAHAEATNNGNQRTTLEATLKEVRLLTGLITDFLNFARPQQLSLTEVDLHEIVEACALELAPGLAGAGIKLRIDGKFASVPGDSSLLRRVFSNLMRNAAEAIDASSSEKLIVVSGAVDSGSKPRYAHVRVSDTGRGISQSDLHHIFIPFFTTKSRGYGIGLALVLKIVVAHDGDVSVERSDSSGTCFHCRLPLASSVDPETQDVH